MAGLQKLPPLALFSERALLRLLAQPAQLPLGSHGNTTISAAQQRAAAPALSGHLHL